jgi:hypothetical protein
VDCQDCANSYGSANWPKASSGYRPAHPCAPKRSSSMIPTWQLSKQNGASAYCGRKR